MKLKDIDPKSKKKYKITNKNVLPGKLKLAPAMERIIKNMKIKNGTYKSSGKMLTKADLKKMLKMLKNKKYT